jgi:hypothetical protein
MKFLKLFFTILITMLLFSCQKDAAIPSDNFQKSYGENLETSGKASAIAPEGSILSIGSQVSQSNGSSMLYLQKTNQHGNLIWQKTFGGVKNEIGEDILLNKDGSIMLLGNTSSFGSGLTDILIVKTDYEGNIIWQNTIGGPGDDFARKIRHGGSNNYYIGGLTDSYGNGGLDFYLAKIDGLGNLIWQKTFGGAFNDGLMDFLVLPNGDLMLLGFTNKNQSENQDFLIINTNHNGDIKWQKTYGGFGYEEPQALAINKDGDILIAGHTASYGDPEHDALLIKINLSGEIIWQRNLGLVNNHEGATNILVSNTGIIHVLVRGGHIDDAYLYCLNNDGILLNMRKFGGKNTDILEGIIEHHESLILTGFTQSFSIHSEQKSNLFLIKTNK